MLASTAFTCLTLFLSLPVVPTSHLSGYLAPAPLGRTELLKWLGDALDFAASPHLSAVKVEDCATGALHAQLLDSLQVQCAIGAPMVQCVSRQRHVISPAWHGCGR